MPIYMDRHNVPQDITAEHVAQMHQADLKVQHLYDCKGLTYWCDENRRTAFCLIEAPNEQALQEMHNHAHGDLPHSIIEVDANLVESFLGRIEDPEQTPGTDLNVITDSAFRILMLTGFKRKSYTQIPNEEQEESLKLFDQEKNEVLARNYGSVVKLGSDCNLISFLSVTRAVNCALELLGKFHELMNESAWDLKISLNAGDPVTGNNSLFEDSIKLTERMYDAGNANIIASPEIKNLYRNENNNEGLDETMIKAITPSDKKFLNSMMDYVEKTWADSNLTVEDISINLGLSKSQLYRKMVSLFELSPNSFIKEYRLKKAHTLLKEQQGNISEIAFDTGFNSPSYFSKCFLETYGILPSDYTKQQH